MIGRGTRLCRNLFGPGQHKKDFFIFDHWGNFERFDVEDYRDREETRSKSVLELLFEARIDLAAAAIEKMERPVFEAAIDLILKDIRDLPQTSVPIRERFRDVKKAENRELLLQFADNTQRDLREVIAPLMQWRDASGEADAYRFDLLATRLQVELLRGTASLDGLRDDVINQVNALRKNLNQVQAKAEIIKRVNAPGLPFWQEPTHKALEDMRVQLRGIMRYRQKEAQDPSEPRVYDIPEEEALFVAEEYIPRVLEGMEMTQYRNRVESVLKRLEKENPTLIRIRKGQPVSEKDLSDLVKIVLVQDSMVDLSLLHEFYPDTAGHLDLAIRRIIGMDSEAVDAEFSAFISRHSASLNARQIQFINLVKNHICRNGGIRIEDLYHDPFTTLHVNGLEGVFTKEQHINSLINIVVRFQPPQGPQPRV
jgi:type I restriction enzyme R subunit